MNSTKKEKLCKTCGIEKPLEDFQAYGRQRLYHRAHCKGCWYAKMRAQMKIWRANNPQKAKLNKARAYLRKIGLQKAEISHILQLLKLYKGCELCGKPGVPYIDHCHSQNTFRGLLCNNCNSALAWFNEDPQLLRKAALYLEKHRCNRIPRHRLQQQMNLLDLKPCPTRPHDP